MKISNGEKKENTEICNAFYAPKRWLPNYTNGTNVLAADNTFRKSATSPKCLDSVTYPGYINSQSLEKTRSRRIIKIGQCLVEFILVLNDCIDPSQSGWSRSIKIMMFAHWCPVEVPLQYSKTVPSVKFSNKRKMKKQHGAVRLIFQADMKFRVTLDSCFRWAASTFTIFAIYRWLKTWMVLNNGLQRKFSVCSIWQRLRRMEA